MFKRKRRERKRLLCLLLATGMIASETPVWASEFDAPYESVDSFDMFSSGEDDTEIFETGEPEPVPTVTPTPEPTVTQIPDLTVTPEPDEEVTAASATVTPAPSVSAAAVTPTPEPTIDPEKEIEIRFIDGEGKECEDVDRMVVKWETTITLPNVPDPEAPNQWKLEQNEKLNDSICLEGGSKLTLEKKENWDDFMEKDVLKLYMPKKCNVTFWNNSGTGTFKTVKAYETKEITLPDIVNSAYINYGWTNTAGSGTVKYALNSIYKVTEDVNLYIVRRLSMQITYLSQNGKSNNTFAKLNRTIGKNLKLTLAEVPAKSGYQALGWALTPNATKAKYTAGQQVTVTDDYTLYAVYKKMPYKVTFNNNAGTSTSSSYTSLTVYADQNQKITLPAVPKAKGYTNLGWTTAKGKKKPLYKAGSQVKITKTTRFYAVRRKSKYYTVTYYMGDGKTNSTYKKLTTKVEEGTKVTFAKVPARSGYINLGWSSKKNSTKATAKASYTVTRNITLYAVQKKAVTLTLCKNNGAVYSTTRMAQGSTYKLSGVKDANGYTFMGWSEQAGQKVNPDYEAEETITVKKNTTLYAVVFNRSSEDNLSADVLPQVNSYKYKNVVFIGDSRTEYMKNALARAGANTNYVKFICKAGEGYSWLTGTAVPQLQELVKNDTNSILSKKTAVIFNFGVNDYNEYAKYAAYYKLIASSLEKKGCELYFMSVNPINRLMLSNTGRADRSEAKIRSFNTYMQKNLLSSYTYIDMYSYLKATGYSFASDKYGAGSIDDGLHYTARTYKRIFTQCLRSLKNS
ncbi:hypothetical protein Blut17040_02830 [Blautia luti]|uniref:Repeat protein n=1 Tax=Blautia luti DSM 14534 = JCM 17040 TaxID=649762 RepID=A0A844GIC9_9FIRM|nr:InlB B-repeat-containing protein [Blautia luti]MTD61816.1 hypothetical protein [Blautia luti DSM 14534 = JCM 17040]RHQ91512.1 hypothetical protein DWX83_08470 [Ruminococcus sp. AF21-42]BEI59254.1 hypothetical protein Blut17040_02830 [Blautia luti]